MVLHLHRVPFRNNDGRSCLSVGPGVPEFMGKPYSRVIQINATSVCLWGALYQRVLCIYEYEI